jgi:hypothetical protein
MFFRWTALSRGLTCCGRDRRPARLLSPCPDRVCRRAQCAGASGPARTAFSTAFSTRRAGRGMRLRGTAILDRPSGFPIAPREASPFRCRLTPGAANQAGRTCTGPAPSAQGVQVAHAFRTGKPLAGFAVPAGKLLPERTGRTGISCPSGRQKRRTRQRAPIERKSCTARSAFPCEVLEKRVRSHDIPRREVDSSTDPPKGTTSEASHG